MNRAIRTLAAVVTTALLLGTGAAAAQGVGTTATGVFTTGAKQVPLPAGSWEVVRSGLNRMLTKSGEATIDPAEYGPVRHAVLAQTEGNRISALVEVHDNTVPNPDGWGTAADCNRNDLYATITRFKGGWDVSCLTVAPVVVNAAAAERPLWADVAQQAKARGAELPTLWVMAGFRVSNRHDVLDVRYYFSPTALGKEASAPDAILWSPATISEQTERLEVVKLVAAWAGAMQAHVESGLTARLAETSFPAVRSPEVASMPTDAERRLATLAALKAEGAIDEAEYTRQAKVIADEAVAPTQAVWTYSQVAAYKALTYRIVVTAINAGIDYVFIGQPFAAGVLVILQVVVNTTKFYFHEMMWQQFLGFSPIQRDTPRVIDFEYLGTTPPPAVKAKA